MNKIVIELCAEDRARLDKLQEAVSQMGNALFAAKLTELANLGQEIKAEVERDAVVHPQTAQEPQGEPEPAEPKNSAPATEEAQEAPTVAAPEVSVAELQSKVVQLVTAGKKDATRAIVQEYAPRVGDIPADKRAEVMKRLEALEG